MTAGTDNLETRTYCEVGTYPRARGGHGDHAQDREAGARPTRDLTTCSNLASWLGDAEQVADAIGQFRQLLVDLARVLGPDHPATLSTRNNLASWLGRALSQSSF
jgi:Tetratricopeptide repeat